MSRKTHLRLLPHINDERGITYKLETQHGHEVGFIISRPGGWTVWSKEGYFQGGAKEHSTLVGTIRFLVAVCQQPICIHGGKNDSQRDFTPTTA